MAVVVYSFGTAGVFCRQSCTRLKFRNLHLQQRFIAHKSEVLIPSTLSATSLCLTRNKLAQKVVRTSQKSQTVTETHENAEIDLVNPKPNEEEKPKTEDSEDIVETLNEVNVVEKETYTNDSRSIRNRYVELSSDENKLNTDAEQSPEVVPKSSPENLNKQFRIWDEWKDWYRQSQIDIRTWGFGKGPIFLVYDNGEGEVKVFINEKELRDRFGSLPFLGDEARVLLDEKLAHADQVARDLERGAFKPSRYSSVYKFADPVKNNLEKRGLVGSYVFSGVSSVIAPAPPTLKFSVVGYYVMCSSLVLWVAWKYIFRNEQEEETGGDRMGLEGEDNRDDSDINLTLDLESKRRAEKEGEVGMRELAMKPSLMGKLWFEKITLQIQHLATQVLSFLALIFQNIRVWIKEAQSGMKPLTMGINSHEFKKRIANIQDVARQALSSFAIGLHNERVTTKKKLPMKPTSTDGVGYKKTITGIQNTAKQSYVMEQNRSQVFSEQDDKDSSNSKTMGGNAETRRRNEDQPSNSNTT